MVKLNESSFEDFIYIVACILTLGSVWIARVLMTKAIKKAFAED